MPTTDPEFTRLRRNARMLGTIATLLLLAGAAMFLAVDRMGSGGFTLLAVIAAAQAICGIAGATFAIRAMRRQGMTWSGTGGSLWFGFIGLCGLLGVPLFFFLRDGVSLGLSGWGRPLRVRGVLVHPKIRAGAEWTRGPAPRVDDLDGPTRRALAAWWLQDAQKEHGSVPAFARVAWQLAALGAPADLLEQSHRAALEEIEHTRICFALVAGYAGAPCSVEAMPELQGNALGDFSLETMATDSLIDGCLLEDLNADAAELALLRAADPAVRAALTAIAAEERSHGELAWNILAWCLERGGDALAETLRHRIRDLPQRGPTPHDAALGALVQQANPAALLAHGRVPAEDWPGLYARRRSLTIERASALLAAMRAAA